MREEEILAKHKTITLTLDDDSQKICQIQCIFSSGDQTLIALIPQGEDKSPALAEKVLLYTFSLGESGEPLLGLIESESDYEAAAKAYEEACGH